MVFEIWEPNHWLWLWFSKFGQKLDQTGPRQHYLVRFFLSLAQGGGQVSKVDIYLDDAVDEVPLDTRLVVELISAGIYAGCATISFNGANHKQCLLHSLIDLSRQMEDRTFPLLKSLAIRSSILFAPEVQEWASSLLSRTPGLSAIDFCTPQSDADEWSAFVRRIRLPSLKSANLGGIDEITVVEFLSNHPNLFSVSFNEITRNERLRVSGPLLRMPDLTLIFGEAQTILNIARILDKSSLSLAGVHIHLDEPGVIHGEYVHSNVFDTAAHLELLGFLASQAASLDLLIVTFPQLDKFTDPFFDIEGDSGRPEVLLNVGNIHVVLASTDSQAVQPLLVSRLAHHSVHGFKLIYSDCNHSLAGSLLCKSSWCLHFLRGRSRAGMREAKLLRRGIYGDPRCRRALLLIASWNSTFVKRNNGR